MIEIVLLVGRLARQVHAKALTDFHQLERKVNREDFLYVVPDFRLNKAFTQFGTLSGQQKAKIEFLCNECCWFGCKDRKQC